jgi:predicted nucleic acid-binding protein
VIAPAVLFDACVLYPQYLRDVILRLAHPSRGLYSPRWSPLILAEVERNLVRNAGVDAGRAAAMIALMRQHFPDAEVSPPDALIAAMTNHPKDRHVLAAAVHAQCDFLVTDNVKDFPVPSCEPFGLAVVTADEFLSDVHKQESDAVLEVVGRLALALRKPAMTVNDVVAALARARLPQFAAILDAQLAALNIEDYLHRLQTHVGGQEHGR